MKPSFIFYFAKKSMKYANIRTALTILAIVVGMFSVVLLTGIARGMNQGIHENLKAIGSDMVVVVPTTVSSNVFITSTSAGFRALTTRFYEKDVEKIKLVPGVEMALPTLTGTVKLEYNGKEFNGNVFGVDKEAINIVHTISIAEGRWLRAKYEVVVGGRVHEQFDEDVRVGKRMIINNKTFKVVGILKPTGDALAKVDNMIFIPFDAARELFKEQYSDDEIASILVKVSDGFDANEVGKRIDEFLMNYKHITDEDRKGYTVITPEFISNQIDSITNTLNLFFLGVSGIAIVVGLVGVGNTMYMNVIDRYREIGTLKAIGAKPRDIMKIYIVEGIFLGFFGAFIGFVLALTTGSLPFIPFSLDAPMALLAFTIVILGSAVASFIPSKIASEIPPSTALRYE